VDDRLRIERMHGGPPGISGPLRHFVGYPCRCCPLVWISNRHGDADRRSLHDFIAGTVVVREKRRAGCGAAREAASQGAQTVTDGGSRIQSLGF